MSLCPKTLAEAAARGPFVRVLVAEVTGSAPREPGATMLVWPDATEGTIGGGALEWQAVTRAREVLARGGGRIDRVPLGPGLGQCCGGAVTLVHERIDAADLVRIAPPSHLRRIAGSAAAPLALHRAQARARAAVAGGAQVALRLQDGWLIEPVAPPALPVWIWGAGHVGRAIVAVLAPLPGLDIHWADIAADRFPSSIQGVTQLIAENPADLAGAAPPLAHHLVLTYSHALDLELCHRLLSRGFAGLGLIGSASKAARFRSRLRALGHAESGISRIVCPIGDPALGKHPQAIAVGVAAALLRKTSASRAGQAEATTKGCAV